MEWSIIVILSKWEERRVVAYTLAEMYTAKHKHREGSKKDLVLYFFMSKSQQSLHSIRREADHPRVYSDVRLPHFERSRLNVSCKPI